MVSLGAFASASPCKTLIVFFVAFKLRCASLIVSIIRPDFDDPLCLFLVQCNCQNGSCRSFDPTFKRYLQMRRPGRPPRTNKITSHHCVPCTDSLCHTVRPCALIPYLCCTNLWATSGLSVSLETIRSFRRGLM